ncbi:MAG: hypothetical protein ABFD83_14765 [Armatimonadota bacterium]
MRAQKVFLANLRERYARELALDTRRVKITAAQNRPASYVTQAIQQGDITWGDRVELEVRN